MSNADLHTREFQSKDTDQVLSLWTRCDLVRAWNNPRLDIERKVAFQPELFLVAEQGSAIVGSAMFGYDGHRAWLYYFAVRPDRQKQGVGRALLDSGCARLVDLGCAKLNLQVREGNDEAIAYYSRAGFEVDRVHSFGRRLIED